MTFSRYEMDDCVLQYLKEESKDGDYICIYGFAPDYECDDLIIPNKIDDLPVKEIAEDAFFGTLLESVVLPENLITIGNRAFQDCDCLKSVSLPNSLRRIGEGAFYRCGDLETIKFNEGLESIGNGAFGLTMLERLTFPDSLITIGDDAFFECELFEVNFGSGLRTIGESAFAGNEKLENIEFPEGLKTIKTFAFENCGLTSVTFPDSLTYLEFTALDGCDFLESLHIGANVSNDNYDRAIAFACLKLKTITVSEKNKNFKVFKDCLYDMRTKELIRAPSNIKTIIIPKWAEAVTPDCFYDINPDTVIVNSKSLKNINTSYIEDAGIIYCIPNSPVENFLKEEGARFASLQSSISSFLENISELKEK